MNCNFYGSHNMEGYYIVWAMNIYLDSLMLFSHVFCQTCILHFLFSLFNDALSCYEPKQTSFYWLLFLCSEIHALDYKEAPIASQNQACGSAQKSSYQDKTSAPRTALINNFTIKFSTTDSAPLCRAGSDLKRLSLSS